MDDNFKRLKKTFLIHAIVKSAVAGVSFALVAVAAVLLSLKLNAIYLNAGIYVAIALGSALIVGGICFLIVRPDDTEIAKRLDSDFNLRERCQTMVAYGGSSGEMVEMQREDAQDKLSSVSSRSVKFKHLWQCIVIFVLALALIFTGAFIPGKVIEASGDEFNADDLHITALEKLIERVESSEMEVTPKVLTVSELNSLLAEVKEIGTKTEMKESVIGTIVAIDKITADANTYPEISAQLKTMGESVQALGNAMTSLSASGMRSSIEAIVASDNPSLQASELAAAVVLSGVSGDSLYSAMEMLINAISAGSSENISQATAEISAAVIRQGVNGDVCVFAIRRLAEIFEISLSELPRLENMSNGPDNNEQGGNTERPGGEQGGVGTGEVNYASDAEVSDPEEGRVKYGDVINDYYSQILGMAGEIGEEDLRNILDYFAVLFGAKDNTESTD